MHQRLHGRAKLEKGVHSTLEPSGPKEQHLAFEMNLFRASRAHTHGRKSSDHSTGRRSGALAVAPTLRNEMSGIAISIPDLLS